MSFCVLGQVASAAVSVAGCENIDTSYPRFVDDLKSVGGAIGPDGSGDHRG
jgi:5-enolpyruvylshikimate-3-phosphate synthase